VERGKKKERTENRGRYKRKWNFHPEPIEIIGHRGENRIKLREGLKGVLLRRN